MSPPLSFLELAWNSKYDDADEVRMMMMDDGVEVSASFLDAHIRTGVSRPGLFLFIFYS